VRSEKDKEALAEDETYEEFSPSFTYPVCAVISSVWEYYLTTVCFAQIYGEDEKIYGYNDLVIDVSLLESDLLERILILLSRIVEIRVWFAGTILVHQLLREITLVVDC